MYGWSHQRVLCFWKNKDLGRISDRKAKQVRGLSLVEILVVVAIIATLIALTASTLIRSKRSAYRAEATAYGRQIGAAHAMYAEDNK